MDIYKKGLAAIAADVKNENEAWSPFSQHFLDNPFNVLLPFFAGGENRHGERKLLTPLDFHYSQIVNLANEFEMLCLQDRTAGVLAMSNKTPYTGGQFMALYADSFTPIAYRND